MQIIFAAMLAGAPVPAPLEYRYEIRRAEGTIYNPWTLSDDRVELRSYIGSGANPGDFVAPTIRVVPGQKLTVDLDNRLETCTAAQKRDHLCFNDTNLHTHGLWISPSGNSDNVMVSIAPGEKFRYEYDIPTDHPAGTFWYHPHRHGNGLVQVGSGMAGALIVTGNRQPTADRPGDIDILLKDQRGRPMAERTMVFQQIEYGCLDERGIPAGKRDAQNEPIRPFTCEKGQVGRIENFETDWGWSKTGRFMGINGKVQPVIGKVAAGQFERWRLINAGTGGTMRLRLFHLDPAAPELRTVRAEDQVAWRQRYCTGAPLPMWQIALDGLTRSDIRKTDESSVFPGERMDILVNLPEAGRYCMFHDTRRKDPEKDNPKRMLAVVEAVGKASPSANADEQLKATLVRSAAKAVDDPAIRDKVVTDLQNGLKLSSFVWHKPIAKEEISGYREAILNVLDGPEATAFRMNGLTHDEHRIDAILPLGKAEEWRAAALAEGHPLHIHVNPFEIISIKDAQGRDLADPASPAYDPDYGGLIGQWKDTVLVKEDVRVAFRTRYERFTGDFVIHCHIMFHGDHGMMQNLRIAADGDKPAEHGAH
ncbi:multicopper oxidase domain-containing protein [Sphingomonas sp. NSE70-1]|uniref:Multicopper oxidase domain-containing protein n=1 Tax=Sphingomonas caseinilyticus TaxID=2908205 RepID=A0ABT0RY46_9SPHN|nr:multicopper oxidase domain-containing protein [Sphingomonas caseinilyticus]MCL6699743.1 multicopper oxidase domain-containing protein [Sphingomonas caseinilyticus]